ncbi:MAG TPA: NUDIX hydrolase [Candidatus Deferrimicrobium sp.]|nr:NUDIX hydrolase [Candidatus Deferrimicrobium sp.]
MTEDLQFIYEKEFWYISVIVNTRFIDCNQKVSEIEKKLKGKLNNLSENDFPRLAWNKELVYTLIELGKNIALKCVWVPYIDSFPFTDENTGLVYNTVGYLQFEVEYYKDTPNKKELIRSELLQEIPNVILKILLEFCGLVANQYFYIDPVSPVFLFAISNHTKPVEVPWSKENVQKYKKEIGQWTEIYSGQWPDYSDELYEMRIQNNLSNRLSELHFIRRNSGFIYMVEENYGHFFDTYMKTYVLEPTGQIRALLFALTSINESLDILFTRQHYHGFKDIEVIEEKIQNLGFLRGMIQTKMSLIYNELDSNKRQHYTRVLTHLIEEFNLDRIIKRIRDKFDVIYDSMEVLYQNKNEEIQGRVERGFALLNVLFGLGVLADLAELIVVFVAGIGEGNLFKLAFHGSISIFITTILIITIVYFMRLRLKFRKEKKVVGETVDAVILDGKGNVLLIKRKYPPFRGQYALPGGFTEPKETPKEALVREIKEEVGFDINVERKIGVYDKKGRDPRGDVISTAFLCSIIGDPLKMVYGDELTAMEWVPLKTLKGVDLAFDHEDILRDAVDFDKYP